MVNFYYHPESDGLTTVGEVQWGEPCYDFDITAVWRDGDTFYWADDSGCSCPVPFEDLNPEGLTKGSFHDMAAMLNDRLAGLHEDDRKYSADDVASVISRGMAAA